MLAACQTSIHPQGENVRALTAMTSRHGANTLKAEQKESLSSIADRPSSRKDGCKCSDKSMRMPLSLHLTVIYDML